MSHINATLYVLVYVDDILIIGTDSNVILSVIKQLQLVFAMKDLGDLGFFLSMQAHRDATGLHIWQSKYVTPSFWDIREMQTLSL